jgi:hypothetical protein
MVIRMADGCSWLRNVFSSIFYKRCTSLRSKIIRDAIFFTVRLMFEGTQYGISVVTQLAPRILKWLAQFWKIVCP